MPEPINSLIFILALGSAALAGLFAAQARPASRNLLLCLGLLELFLVVQAGLSLGRLVAPPANLEVPIFLGYLSLSVLLLPAALWWSQIEESRWSVLVLAVGALVGAVLQVRLGQLWLGR